MWKVDLVLSSGWCWMIAYAEPRGATLACREDQVAETWSFIYSGIASDIVRVQEQSSKYGLLIIS